STRASVIRYLRSIDMNPRGVVIQRGARNYAGGDCPGSGWTCTTTAHPVVQVAAAGGENVFRCATASCAVVQVAAQRTVGTNFATCPASTKLVLACTISQISTDGTDNQAVAYQDTSRSLTVKNSTSSPVTQTASSSVSITQVASGAGAGSNTACVHQAIALAGSGTYNAGRLKLVQEAHLSVTITQDSTDGDNSANESATAEGACTGTSILQRQTLYSKLTVARVIRQRQNAKSLGANMAIDIEQNQSPSFFGTASGKNFATFDQESSLTAIGNSPVGVHQTQNSDTGGLLGTINEDSSDVSSASATQTSNQCENAATGGLTDCTTDLTPPVTVTQKEVGSVRKGVGVSKQTRNALDTFTVDQTSTLANNGGAGSHLTDNVQGDCSTLGNCTVTQHTDSNGQQANQTQSGQDVNITTNCTGSACTNAKLLHEDFETGAPGWTMTGKWHVQNQPENVSVVSGIRNQLVSLPDSGALPAAFDGTNDAWFGDAATGTYCGTDWQSVANQPLLGGCTSSTTYQGDLTSPVLDLSNVTAADLSFETWWEIESIAPSSYDQMSVQYSTDGGDTWTEAALLNPDDGPPGATKAKPLSNIGFDQSPAWAKTTVDLSGAVGSPNVVVRFDFYTGDTKFNGFRGWALDNIDVNVGG
ncbi:MAG TPA: hypothetical protein VNF91_02850, partial [Candidatus Acidoferrum sp.]|nr:hypothetical protein [Candidatus Acidoferrum sp.]